MERQFKGIWIPADIWLDENLTVMEKVLYAEIDSFCGNGKECFCSNAHFAKVLQVSERQVRRLLCSLEEKGVISRRLVYKEGNKEVDKRYLKAIPSEPFDTTPTDIDVPTPTDIDVRTPGEEIVRTPGDGNVRDTNTVFTKEEEEEAAWQKVLRSYQENIHPITSRVQLEKLQELLKDYGEKWVVKAIEAAALRNGRSISYLTATLEAWKRQGFKGIEKEKPVKEEVKPLSKMTRDEALAYYAERNRLEMERLARERAT